LVEHVDALAPLAGFDDRGIVRVDAEPLREARAAIEVEHPDLEPRSRVAVEPEKRRGVLPARRRLARRERDDADVAAEATEDVARVRREREAPIGRQVDAPGMAGRQRDQARED